MKRAPYEEICVGLFLGLIFGAIYLHNERRPHPSEPSAVASISDGMHAFKPSGACDPRNTGVVFDNGVLWVCANAVIWRTASEPYAPPLPRVYIPKELRVGGAE